MFSGVILNHQPPPHPVIELAGLNGYMELTTERDLIKGVAKRWFRQYKGSLDDTRSIFSTLSETKRETLTKLQALETDTATIEDVAAIVGNNSWTRLVCDGCAKEVAALLTVGQRRDYDSNTADLCESCVKAAASIKWD